MKMCVDLSIDRGRDRGILNTYWILTERPLHWIVKRMLEYVCACVCVWNCVCTWSAPVGSRSSGTDRQPLTFSPCNPMIDVSVVRKWAAGAPDITAEVRVERSEQSLQCICVCVHACAGVCVWADLCARIYLPIAISPLWWYQFSRRIAPAIEL